MRRAGDVQSDPDSSSVTPWRTAAPRSKGEFARTLNLTDVYTGWVFLRAIRNNVHTHILTALHAVDEIPDAVTGAGFDNGSEFLNDAVIGWAS